MYYRTARRLDTDELHQKLQNYNEFFLYLQRIPETDAIGIVRRLRALPDPTAILASLEGGAVHTLKRPSDIAVARAVSVPTDTSIEFELMACHRSAYIKIIPVTRSFLESLVDGTPSVVSTSLITSPASHYSSPGTLAPTPLPPSPGLRDLIDQRLKKLRIAYWTRVAIDDDFAAQIISAYLEKEHMITPFFDADIVLADLVACQPRFCSAFLVSALMFLACYRKQSYTPLDVRAAGLAVNFRAEAELLYRGECSVDSIITVSGMMVFTAACFYHGAEALAHELLGGLRSMAGRLALFGVASGNPVALSHLGQTEEWRRAASQVAWAAYNFLSLLSIYHEVSPIKYPPILPIPNTPPPKGKERATTPLDLISSRRYVSPVFHTTCKLYVIAQEIAAVYKVGDGTKLSSERVPLAFLEAKYQKLLECLGEVEEGVLKDGNGPIHLIVFYIECHIVILSLFQPFQNSPDATTRLPSFTSLDCSPRTVYDASINQLKQLVLWAHLRYRESLPIYVNGAFLMLIGALTRADETTSSFRDMPTERLYFLLCLKCVSDLYVQYPLFVNMAQAFLAMAIQQHGYMSGAEAVALLEGIKRRGSHHAAPDEAGSSAIADPAEPQAAKMNILAQKFEVISLMDQFTHVNDNAGVGDGYVSGLDLATPASDAVYSQESRQS
ncbi:hypothetical protein OQA88_9681 [Cercophora sp. LCS_1]